MIRIEDSEIRSGIAAATGHPLPVSIVGRQFKVEQLFRKIGLAPSPVGMFAFSFDGVPTEVAFDNFAVKTLPSAPGH